MMSSGRQTANVLVRKTASFSRCWSKCTAGSCASTTNAAVGGSTSRSNVRKFEVQHHGRHFGSLTTTTLVDKTTRSKLTRAATTASVVAPTFAGSSLLLLRGLSSTAIIKDGTSTGKASGGKTETGVKKSDDNNKDDKQSKSKSSSSDSSNIFLDNLGKIFFAAIGTIIGMLIRSSMGNSNNTKERERLEEISALDPLEIDDLRFVNSLNNFNLELFKQVADAVQRTFQNKQEVTYEEFVAIVRQILADLKGTNQYTIQFGHFVDRVIIDILQQQQEEGEGAETFDNEKTLPLHTYMTALSLALSGTIEERAEALFYIMTRFPAATDQNAAEQQTGGTSENTVVVTEQDMIAMVDNLRNTCQLPPGPQILKTSHKYPIQQYRRGTGEELFTRARDDIWTTSTNTSDTSENTTNNKHNALYTLEDLETILQNTFVCAWGECYGSKRSKKKQTNK